MADYATILRFANADHQVMIKDWLNRVVNNVYWCYQAALYGLSPFRSLKHMASTADTYETVFYGRYYHQNTNLVMVYRLLAASTGTDSSEEDAGVYNEENGNDCDNLWGAHQSSFSTDATAAHGHNLDMQFCLKKGSTWYVYYSGAWHEMPDDTPTDYIACSTPIPDYTDNKLGSIDADLTALDLTVGSAYDVKVQIRNCALFIRYIYAEHVAGETYSLPASVADGVHLHYHDWNLYLDSLDYLKREVDAPRGPTWGVYQRDGDNKNDTHPTRIWHGWVKHISNTLKYRWLQDVTGSGSCVGSLYYNNTELTNELTGEAALPMSTPATAEGTDAIWHVAEGTADLSGLGLTIGNFYELDVRISSTDTNANPPQGTIDYLFEVDGVPASALNCHHPVVHGYYVRGDAPLIPDSYFHAENLSTDFGTAKTACDRAIQMICPDVVTDGTWPQSGAGQYSPNDLSFIRQRTTLLWGGSVSASQEITIYWGDGDNPQSQGLGLGVTYGLLDLRSLSGLDVGVRYWMTPRAKVICALEF